MTGDILVRVLCGSSGELLCTLEAVLSDRVRDLKQLIRRKEGTRVAEQLLFLGERPLEDADTIVGVLQEAARCRTEPEGSSSEEDLVLELLDVTLLRAERPGPVEGPVAEAPSQQPCRLEAPVRAGGPEVPPPSRSPATQVPQQCPAAGRPDGPGSAESRRERLVALRKHFKRLAAVRDGGMLRYTLAPGTRVELSGLKGSKSLNGHVGVVKSFDAGECRYNLELEEDGELRTVSVKPENLVSLYVVDALDEAAGSPEESPLAAAVRHCDVFQVQALLRDGADPNSRNAAGQPLFLDAVASGEVGVVALMLGYGAEPSLAGLEDLGEDDDPFNDLVRSLGEIFQQQVADTEDKCLLLESLDPGVLAQARRWLKLPGPFALGGMAPAACMRASQRIEYMATADHRVDLHYGDTMRPVLALRPLQGRPSAMVVLLHGLYQSGQMFERLVRELSWALPHALLLMPTAPTRKVFAVGPAWFNAYGSVELREELEEGRAEILELISLQQLTADVPLERVVLLGFSLGASMAVWTALQMPRGLAGLVILGTGDIASAAEQLLPTTRGAQRLPVLQCHGSSDGLVPPAEAQATGEWLRELGCSVRFSLHDGVGHALSPVMFAEIQLWLSDQLPLKY